MVVRLAVLLMLVINLDDAEGYGIDGSNATEFEWVSLDECR